MGDEMALIPGVAECPSGWAGPSFEPAVVPLRFFRSAVPVNSHETRLGVRTIRYRASCFERGIVVVDVDEGVKMKLNDVRWARHRRKVGIQPRIWQFLGEERGNILTLAVAELRENSFVVDLR